MEILNSEQISGNILEEPDAIKEFYTNLDATQNTPTFSRRVLGASLNIIIAQYQEKTSRMKKNGIQVKYPLRRKSKRKAGIRVSFFPFLLAFFRIRR